MEATESEERIRDSNAGVERKRGRKDNVFLPMIMSLCGMIDTEKQGLHEAGKINVVDCMLRIALIKSLEVALREIRTMRDSVLEMKAEVIGLKGRHVELLEKLHGGQKCT